MIISHHHRFVFVRSCKTGSTSTALAIRRAQILDSQTDVSNLVEGPMNSPFHRPLNMPAPMPSASQFDKVAPHSRDWLNPMKRAMHLNLPELVALGFLSAEQAQEYDVYVGIREPLDKMVSSAHFVLSSAPDVVFQNHGLRRPESVQQIFDDGVLEKVVPILTMPQSHWFETDNPEKLKFIRFDDLPNQVAKLIERYGGSWHADRMPRRKAQARDRQADTAENLLNPETIERLRATYREDEQCWQSA